MSRSDAITIGADPHESRRASLWLEATCGQLGVPQPHVDRLALCLEEVLANIIAHGGRAALSGSVQVQLEVEPRIEGDYEARVTVSDAGEAFDPLSARLAASPKAIDEALPHGMGLGIIRQCSSSLGYRREDGRNHLTFGTRWSAESNRA